MGAKQSKRSVDISGKEAESAGEVAAAGAGGEGRVEQLADADALKPQLNGDAHIHEPSDKEKQLDSGTPENEKDATTEKESKDQDEELKETAPLTNGDSEQKVENGESSPADDSKKPKKEKVKKKWSLRSISFSRKDKPKQEKKKEEETKTNGEPDKVPEEIAETPDTEKNEIVEEKADAEVKEQKTPETPVTEPITNGSSTPETPKEESLAVDEATVVVKESDRPETPKVETVPAPEPQQLPVNGHIEEEPKEDTPTVLESETSKPEESSIEKIEPVPATEIPVKNEVCVEKMPLIEPTPPPLPANPPPSSVVSFAATTMAPELTDASLANTADISSNTTQVETDDSKIEKTEVDMITPHKTDVEIITPEKTDVEEVTSDVQIEAIPVVAAHEFSNETLETPEEIVSEKLESTRSPSNEEQNYDIKVTASDVVSNIPIDISLPVKTDNLNGVPDENSQDSLILKENKIPKEIISNDLVHSHGDQNESQDSKELDSVQTSANIKSVNEIASNGLIRNDEILENVISIENDTDSNELIDNETENIVRSNNLIEKIEIVTEEDKIMTNGEATESAKVIASAEDLLPPSEALAGGDASEPLPPPPRDCDTQELTTSDKIAELIPEVPNIPELKTELESTTDVAVAN